MLFPVPLFLGKGIELDPYYIPMGKGKEEKAKLWVHGTTNDFRESRWNYYNISPMWSLPKELEHSNSLVCQLPRTTYCNTVFRLQMRRLQETTTTAKQNSKLTKELYTIPWINKCQRSLGMKVAELLDKLYYSNKIIALTILGISISHK